MEDIAVKFEKYGLININKLDSSIKVDLKYASDANFMKTNMYGSLKEAWLRPELAERLAKAQEKLKKYRKDLSLLIFDAARPVSIQRLMYERVKGTPQAVYVADPGNNGGFHNYGMAVDLTVTNEETGNLDMGSDFDFFGEESHAGSEIELYKRKKISLDAVKNRFLLYSFMLEEELFPHPHEWWHYQYHLDEKDKNRFGLLDF
ncbi:MAG: M15 family metallopeptidase [Tannerella sp.]|jgi:D-alanyl-D-alanine dipeptidase|nr:M15 family metallopeptidase [Tannerella sp.]